MSFCLLCNKKWTPSRSISMDKTPLTDEEAAMIKERFELSQQDMSNLVREIFERLFMAFPGSTELFSFNGTAITAKRWRSHMSFVAHVDKIANALTMIVSVSDNKGDLDTYLMYLDQFHLGFNGIKKVYFEVREIAKYSRHPVNCNTTGAAKLLRLFEVAINQ